MSSLIRSVALGVHAFLGTLALLLFMASLIQKPITLPVQELETIPLCENYTFPSTFDGPQPMTKDWSQPVQCQVTL